MTDDVKELNRDYEGLGKWDVAGGLSAVIAGEFASDFMRRRGISGAFIPSISTVAAVSFLGSKKAAKGIKQHEMSREVIDSLLKGNTATEVPTGVTGVTHEGKGVETDQPKQEAAPSR